MARSTRMRFSLVWLVLLPCLGLTGWRAEALDVAVPLSAPLLSALKAVFPVGESDAALVAALRYDEKGKVIGEATIDDAAASVKGSVKLKSGVWAFQVVFKGVAEKVALSVSGVIGAGTADIKYVGPKGKAKIEDFPIELDATLGDVMGKLTLDIAIDPKGKITGTGEFTSGLGNDSPAPCKLSGKISVAKLTIKLGCGKQKVAFKGAPQGAAYVGTLSVTSKPAKEKITDFILQGEELQLPDGGGGPSGGTCRSDKEHFLSGIALTVTDPAGSFGNLVIYGVFKDGSRACLAADFSVTLGDLYYLNSEERKIPETDQVPPTSPGEWFTLPVFVYDISRPGKTTRYGAVTFTVTGSGAGGVEGTWILKPSRSGRTIKGTWREF